jgi:hypothetical protein
VITLDNIKTVFDPYNNRIASRETLMIRSLPARVDGTWATDASFTTPIGWDLNPVYQRGNVWTDRQAEQFMGHMLGGGAVGPLLLNMGHGNPDHPVDCCDEVIDGKQRITAAVRWVKGEIAAEMYDGRRVYLRDFDERAALYVTGMTGLHFEVQYFKLTLVERMELYLRLNRGGTVHSDDEIERVRALLAEAKAR